jgi:hypothetical protein
MTSPPPPPPNNEFVKNKPPPTGCASFPLVTFVKSWTLEVPGWTMRGPPIFFPCNSFKIYISPKAIISVFYSRCKFKKQIFCEKKLPEFLVKKFLNKKMLAGC